MKNILISSLIFLVVICVSCSRNSNLESALIFAGDNRPEIEKVITHYSRSEEDSLKLKAAIFLIENMPGHVSYDPRYIDPLYEQSLDILHSTRSRNERAERLTQLAMQHGNIPVVEDIHIITADYLIDNIDAAFLLWEKPWARHLTFDLFCDYLLPYKCMEGQPLDNWREYFADKFNLATNTITPNDESLHSVYHRSGLINQEIRSKSGNSTWTYNGPRLLSAPIVEHLAIGKCWEQSANATIIMRSHGIPAVMEYLPLWGRREQGHDWHSVLNNNGKHLAFPWNLDSKPGDVVFPDKQLPKVFRVMYSRDECHSRYVKESLYPLNTVTEFYKDVTDEYTSTARIEVPVHGVERLADKKYAYIAAWNNTNWQPVYFGEINNGKAVFENMGVDMMYLALGYDGHDLVTISSPFSVLSNGEITFYEALDNSGEQVVLSRKYPKSVHTADMERKILECQIQASNDPYFIDCDTLYQISNIDYPIPFEVDSSRKYKYWRFIGTRWNCTIAELQFVPATSSVSDAEYKIICSENLSDSVAFKRAKEAFDDNWLTYYSCDEPHAWIGCEFTEPVSVKEVICVPRSDDNMVHLGETYELMFWGGDGWQSLGGQIAGTNKLVFDDVPQNSLLLLRNHTKGKQERIFTYENHKQVWW